MIKCSLNFLKLREAMCPLTPADYVMDLDSHLHNKVCLSPDYTTPLSFVHVHPLC